MVKQPGNLGTPGPAAERSTRSGDLVDVTRGSLVQAEMGSKMETLWMFTAE